VIGVISVRRQGQVMRKYLRFIFGRNVVSATFGCIMRNLTPGPVLARAAPDARRQSRKFHKRQEAAMIGGGRRRHAPRTAAFSPSTAGAEKMRMAITVRP